MNSDKSRRFVCFAVLAVLSFVLMGTNTLRNSTRNDVEQAKRNDVETLAGSIAIQAPKNMRAELMDMAKKSPEQFLQMTCDLK